LDQDEGERQKDEAFHGGIEKGPASDLKNALHVQVRREQVDMNRVNHVYG
jgi:hypothetical protein